MRNLALAVAGLALLAGCAGSDSTTGSPAVDGAYESSNAGCYYLYSPYVPYEYYTHRRPSYYPLYYMHGPYGPYCDNPYVPYGRPRMNVSLLSPPSDIGPGFMGRGSFYASGVGNVEIDKFDGSQCFGRFTFENRWRGAGQFVCSDGRMATFSFTFDGHTARGEGSLDEQSFTFTMLVF